MGREQYQAVLSSIYKTPHTALQGYDAVFHLRSAAVGATKYYKTDLVRTDTIEQAAGLDSLTMMQWDTHPEFHLIPNPTGFANVFEVKMNILIEHIEEAFKK